LHLFGVTTSNDESRFRHTAQSARRGVPHVLGTIGYVQPAFWKAVLAIVLWPYYVGVSLRVVPQ